MSDMAESESFSDPPVSVVPCVVSPPACWSGRSFSSLIGPGLHMADSAHVINKRKEIEEKKMGITKQPSSSIPSSSSSPCGVHPSLTHVILDSGAFLSFASSGYELLSRLWTNCNDEWANIKIQHPEVKQQEIVFCTVPQVMAELKDEKTRQLLSTLPFKIEVITPDEKYIKEAVRFCELSGDFSVLSPTDVHVLALLVQQEIYTNNNKFIRNQPRKTLSMDTPSSAAAASSASSSTPTSTSDPSSSSTPFSSDLSTASTLLESSVPAPPCPCPSPCDPQRAQHQPADHRITQPHQTSQDQQTTDPSNSNTCEVASSSDSVDARVVNDSDDEGEWISPSSLAARSRAAPVDQHAEPSSSVACITTDYAMQNVILQFGMRLLSLRGRTVKSIRTWMKKCHACSALEPAMERQFCRACGHHTLIRVNVTVSRTGLVRYWHGSSHLNLRGTVYSIPKPVGGRHANNLKLSEDVVDEKIRKQGWGWKGPREKTPNELFQNSIEFGLNRVGANSNDNVYGYGRKNPNEYRGFKGGNKKKGAK